MLYLVFDRWSKAGARRPYLLNGREEMETRATDKVNKLLTLRTRKDIIYLHYALPRPTKGVAKIKGAILVKIEE
jgi:hypothetical protein